MVVIIYRYYILVGYKDKALLGSSHQPIGLQPQKYYLLRGCQFGARFARQNKIKGTSTKLEREHENKIKRNNNDKK